MRRRSYILGVTVLALALMGAACSLNPQPYPPGATFANDDAGAVAKDAGSPFADASLRDAGGGLDSAPPPDSDAGSDAATDGAADAGDDAGDADAPSDGATEGG